MSIWICGSIAQCLVPGSQSEVKFHWIIIPLPGPRLEKIFEGFSHLRKRQKSYVKMQSVGIITRYKKGNCKTVATETVDIEFESHIAGPGTQDIIKVIDLFLLTRGQETRKADYHDDDGYSFYSGSGGSYGESYTTGDIIGCYLNFRIKIVFYTKIGVSLGNQHLELKVIFLKRIDRNLMIIKYFKELLAIYTAISKAFYILVLGLDCKAVMTNEDIKKKSKNALILEYQESKHLQTLTVRTGSISRVGSDSSNSGSGGVVLYQLIDLSGLSEKNGCKKGCIE
ncbi:hypothetical protein C2G38_2226518 [Gigaspora rosea]|uniref:SPRY domain-containing protein n=1 Tax=Gigaspora rosea TaxID=44941 RepID=A0A397U1I8_9GLOM|nr:hypothetical protein C2G38_2226518 [Gigaspora rosea]